MAPRRPIRGPVCDLQRISCDVPARGGRVCSPLRALAQPKPLPRVSKQVSRRGGRGRGLLRHPGTSPDNRCSAWVSLQRVPGRGCHEAVRVPAARPRGTGHPRRLRRPRPDPTDVCHRPGGAGSGGWDAVPRPGVLHSRPVSSPETSQPQGASNEVLDADPATIATLGAASSDLATDRGVHSLVFTDQARGSASW